jgi:molybdopterin converting factor small subunit
VDELEVEGQTVGECINQLVAKHPDMQKALFDKNGKLKNIIDIYLNQESTYPKELEKPVKDGDEIHITVILAGG